MVLTKDQKAFLVVRFAMFDEPADAVAAFKEAYGEAPDSKHAWVYNAAFIANRRRLGKELLALFDSARAEYLSRIQDIPIANQVWRLEQMQKLIGQLRKSDSPDVDLILRTLEQAAKETGGAYSNKIRVNHSFDNVSDDELINELDSLRSRLGAVAGGEASGSDPQLES